MRLRLAYPAGLTAITIVAMRGEQGCDSGSRVTRVNASKGWRQFKHLTVQSVLRVLGDFIPPDQPQTKAIAIRNSFLENGKWKMETRRGP
ncbi:uncharacterized protein BDV14DRAFT_168380 [Aspergillus stella-maris]|uniref:uncharacterized protein n=1 Tax=Aspergillus stella-maris TaxID=1810926 RepID=UPI003CCD3E9A